MTYYKVTEQKEISFTNGRRGVHHIFVYDELYTEKELQRLFINVDKSLPDFLSKVDVKRGSTYWFFGARFEK